MMNSAQQWFAARSPREQLGLQAAAALLGVCVFWQIGVAPALQVWRSSQTQQAKLDQQLADMQAWQQEAQQLQQQIAAAPPDSLHSLQTLAATLGPSTQVQPQADQFHIQFKDAAPQALAEFITQARLQARAKPVQAHWQAHQGRWEGQLVLTVTNNR
jgi:general secretion pathway protein M